MDAIDSSPPTWTPHHRIHIRRPRAGEFLIDVDETWVAKYTFEVREGQPVFTGIEVFPGDARKLKLSRDGREPASPGPPGGLTATALRGVRLGDHLAELYNSLAQRLEEAEGAREVGPRPSQLPPGPLRPHGDVLPAVATFHAEDYGLSPEELEKKPRRRGRRGESDPWYAQVAQRYATAVTGSQRHRVAAAVAEEMSRELKSYYTARHVKELVYEARQRGFLTPTQRGRAGGNLTDRARAVLASAAARRVKAG